MAAGKIMFQGTGSDVGKSILTAGLARILAQEGYKVAPFKAQNMALNSYITAQGGEIGRAQAVQAQAAKVEATSDMNPILLKPKADTEAQVIIHGRAKENMSAKEYFTHRSQEVGLPAIKESLRRLESDYEVLVLEGAGSPAEVNLREYDLVNMTTAKLSQAPVILVADIDRGGVFASIVGTLELLTAKEQTRIKGVIINKFRGDKARLKPGLDYLEEECKLPVLGVVPYLDQFRLPEEDALPDSRQGVDDYKLDIGVVKLPHISNFTDFTPLSWEPETRLRYLDPQTELPPVDAVVLPGSKNPIEDLKYLYETGCAEEIVKAVDQGVMVVGVCGGYQMLGEVIYDPHGMEACQEEIKGLGLLEVETTLKQDKVTHQVEARVLGDELFFKTAGSKITGYEIHLGETELKSEVEPMFELTTRSGRQINQPDGAYSSELPVWGTYLHGLFNNDGLRREFINYLRQKKGLTSLTGEEISVAGEIEKSYNKLADILRNNLDLGQIKQLINNC
jgi:adenosylcobyric acid synthase